MSELSAVVVELPEQLAGLLGSPRGGGVLGDAEDVHGARAYLYDEQGVQPLQSDDVDVEQVGSDRAVGLGFEE
ncbi:hypothetical protein [Streptomyces sp. CA-106131]|uniref:hypothetical protein n=1 Tax=Streptomyces sp. CA-106131 TaxID=3240045 RepID=UPI003D89DBB6